MSIIKKLFKFLYSRIMYFILGLSFSVVVIFVNAAIVSSPVPTGALTPLTADRWNQVISDLNNLQGTVTNVESTVSNIGSIASKRQIITKDCTGANHDGLAGNNNEVMYCKAVCPINTTLIGGSGSCIWSHEQPDWEHDYPDVANETWVSVCRWGGSFIQTGPTASHNHAYAICEDN